MDSIHFYQCGACRKLHKGADSFEAALYCCRVREIWECGKCGKKFKTKNARKLAENCCFEKDARRKSGKKENIQINY